MDVRQLSRFGDRSALILAPALGVVAAVALPALRSARGAEIAAIASHPDRFYVYALTILLSSLLTVPAIFAVMRRLRGHKPVLTYVAGGLAQLGVLISIGDAAAELMYWKIGTPGANRSAMVALAERYENSSGVSLIYSVGGLLVVGGIAAIAFGLWRTRRAPRWAAAGLVVSVVMNIVGFGAASQPLLVVSYVVLLAAFGRIAMLDLDDAVVSAPATDSRERGGVDGATAAAGMSRDAAPA
jgi:hypothetical protein